MKKSKPLHSRITFTMLKRLRERKITNAKAAEALGVSETHLSRTVAAIQSKDPGRTPAERVAATKLYAMRREVHSVLAKKVLRGRLTLSQAALEAGCSERTMFRYVAAYRR